MKKIVSIVLVFAMTAILGVSAFAESTNEVSTLTLEEKMELLTQKQEKMEQLKTLEDEKELIKTLNETLQSQRNDIVNQIEYLRNLAKDAKDNRDFNTARSLLTIKKNHLLLASNINEVNIQKADIQLAIIDAREAEDINAFENLLNELIQVLESNISYNNEILDNLNSL